MKYIADALTMLRWLCAAVVLLAGLFGNWDVALAVFIFGILSDAFDGPAARRWPYTDQENARCWWRKDPHAFDNTADLMLSGAGMIGLSLHYLVWWQAALVVAGLGALSFVIQTIVDHVGPTNPRLAERIDVAHGWLFGAELIVMLVIMTLLASATWLWPFYAGAGAFLLWFKWDRITSRSELTYGA